MRFAKTTITVVTISVAILLPLLVQSRSIDNQEQRQLLFARLNSHTQIALNQLLGETWPKLWGLQKTGEVNASFTCNGQIGVDYFRGPDSDRLANFETPPGSGIEYLCGGTIWLGGIVGSDTLVSIGFNDWRSPCEFGPTSSFGTVNRSPFVSDYTMTAEFTDTIRTYEYDFLERRAHKPLGVKVVTRSHAIRSSPANNCVFYEMMITNFQQNQIREGYVGWYVDADVGAASDFSRYLDDLTGILPGDSIAYVIDNDGDPIDGQFVCPKIFAFKFLSSSFVPQRFSYNWWVTDYNLTVDFGPQTRAKYRDLLTGGTGAPRGDRSLYAFLSNGEWDYDQFMTGSITPSDPVWTYPDQQVAMLVSRGYDTRFLVSMGPFNLDPGESVSIQYVTFTGGPVHTDTGSFHEYLENLYIPELYLAALNFSDILRNSSVADSIAPLLINPINPPSDLRVTATDPAGISLAWDTLFNAGIDGYNIYATPVPDSLFPHKGTISPWLREWQPDAPVLYRQIGKVNSTVLSDLIPCRWYAINMTAGRGGVEGPMGKPSIIARLTTEAHFPVFTDSLFFTEHGAAPTLHWRLGEIPAQVIRVYKFSDPLIAQQAFTPFYSTDSSWLWRTSPDSEKVYPIDTVDYQGESYYYYSLTQYAQISGHDTSWTDSDWHMGDTYRITLIDTCGFESGFSASARCFDATRTKDILIMFQVNQFIASDSIVTAFNQLVSEGFSFDIVPWYGLPIDEEMFMGYRMVLLDATWNDGIGAFSLGNMNPYVASGGKLAYFGSLNHASLGSAITGTRYNLVPNAETKSLFKVDSVLSVSPLYYRSQSDSHADTAFGFRGADPGELMYAPLLNYDTTTLLPPSWYGFFESKTGAGVATFSVSDPFDDRVIYRYRSLWGDSSFCNGRPVGVLTKGDGFETYLFGFHLWSMETEGASQLVRWMADRVPTDVRNERESDLPAACWLGQNYPNPFNPTTRIRFALPRKSHVNLEVFNLLGQRVATLVDGRMGAGEHTLIWDGRGEGSNSVASGIYLYRLRTDDAVQVKKMVLLK